MIEPKTETSNILREMNDRSREVFRRVVEGYLANGDPVGSRTLTRDFSEKVSAATIRNVMQDLEYMGVLGSPHVSAGRIPTQLGLRMFVDGMIEIGDPTDVDREKIDATMGDNAADVGGALVVLVFLTVMLKTACSRHRRVRLLVRCVKAANFLNAIVEGKTISEVQRSVAQEMALRRQEIDTLAQQLVESGLALWTGDDESSERLIVRGRSNLLASEAEEAARTFLMTLNASEISPIP
ncbi:Heat-inducible transcription repressor HrcA [Nymphon striatum]|nr:Heat-inducible transcription repressor HrcA [Nymphon striatum]